MHLLLEGGGWAYQIYIFFPLLFEIFPNVLRNVLIHKCVQVNAFTLHKQSRLMLVTMLTCITPVFLADMGVMP